VKKTAVLDNINPNTAAFPVMPQLLSFFDFALLTGPYLPIQL
jgi:hypothetical protein